MGNAQTKEGVEVKSSDKGKETQGPRNGAKFSKEVKDEEEEKQRKASVTMTQWSNEERNARFSELRIENDEMFVSTIFNTKFLEIKENIEEVSEPTTEQIRNESDLHPVRSVNFKHNTQNVEDTVCIHTKIDETDQEKNIDYITLTLEVEIAKNLVIYTFHQYNGSQWTKTEIEQVDGSSKVQVDVYNACTTETIYFTMRYMQEEIVVPSDGYEYKNSFSTHQRISFPEGSVRENTKISISTISVEGECKKKRLKDELGSDPIISSLSDIVYVHHSQPFKKPVKLRLKLDILFNEDESSDTHFFHCDDKGSLTVLDDAKMTKLPKEQVGEDRVYETEVGTFSGVGAFRGTLTLDYATRLMTIYGLGVDHCRILVYLLEENNRTHLWSDVVPEKNLEKRRNYLEEYYGLIHLKNTVSPSVPVMNFSRLRVTLSKSGRVLSAPEVPANSTFMYYDRNAAEIYNHFPIVLNKGLTNENAIIQYEIDTAPKRLLHTAYFNAEIHMNKLRSKRQNRGEKCQNAGNKKTSLPDLR